MKVLDSRVAESKATTTRTPARSSSTPAYYNPKSCWNPEKCCKYCKDLGFGKCAMQSCKKCQCDFSGFSSFGNKLQKKSI